MKFTDVRFAACVQDYSLYLISKENVSFIANPVLWSLKDKRSRIWNNQNKKLNVAGRCPEELITWEQ